MSTVHHISNDQERAAAINEFPKDNTKLLSVSEAIGTALPIVEIHSFGQRAIQLSASNLEHGDISFFAVNDFFSPTVFGGCDSDNEANQKLTVIWEGQSFQTDIDGSEWTLRDRSDVADCLFMLGAKVGDYLIIDRIALHVYAFRIRSQAAMPV